MISGILSVWPCLLAAASCCTARAMTSASVPARRCRKSGRTLSALSRVAASCFWSVRSAPATFLQHTAGLKTCLSAGERASHHLISCLDVVQTVLNGSMLLPEASGLQLLHSCKTRHSSICHDYQSLRSQGTTKVFM